MIAFASVVASPDKFARYAAPGLALACEADSPVAEFTDATSMCSAYNEILDAFAAAEHLEALVLLHEDTEIRDPQFCAKVRERLDADPDIAVIGVVGASEVRSLRWWEHRGAGRVHETRGLVDFATVGTDVDAVDGLLMVLSPWAVRNLRFDEDFEDFHGYDIDLCFAARAAGRRVVVDDLDVFHHTKGGYGDEDAFRRADERWTGKWLDAQSAPAEAAVVAAATEASAQRPRAAGVREDVDGPLGRYYDGERADLAELVPLDARRILDVGCGTGSLAVGLRDRQGAEVAGIEFMPEAAEQARRRLDHFIEADLDALDELPFADGYFDAIIFGDVLEHLRDPQRLLSVVRRVLAPQGRIICSIPNVKHWTVVLPLVLDDRFPYADQGLLDRTHVHFFTLDEAVLMLDASGFAVEHVGAHRVPLRADLVHHVDLLTAGAADPAEQRRRMEAYQYLVVARRTDADRG